MRCVVMILNLLLSVLLSAAMFAEDVPRSKEAGPAPLTEDDSGEDAQPAGEAGEAGEEAPVVADEPTPPSEPAKPRTADGWPVGKRAGYVAGYDFGSKLVARARQMGISLEDLVRGLEDGLGEVRPTVPRDTWQGVMQVHGQEMARANLLRGESWLAQIKQERGDEVQVTASGLAYEVVEAGEGAKPKATSTVKVHYHGRLLDGSVFDSSMRRGQPVEFPLNKVIPGWTEGLQLMAVGGKYRFHIKSDLAYGPKGGPGIPPNALLIFDVELLEIK